MITFSIAFTSLFFWLLIFGERFVDSTSITFSRGNLDSADPSVLMEAEPTQPSTLTSSVKVRVYLWSSGMLLFNTGRDDERRAFIFWCSFSSFSNLARILLRSDSYWSHFRSRMEICLAWNSIVSCISSICFFFLSREVWAATLFFSFFLCTFSSHDRWSNLRLRPGTGLESLSELEPSSSQSLATKNFDVIFLEFSLFLVWWLGKEKYEKLSMLILLLTLNNFLHLSFTFSRETPW